MKEDLYYIREGLDHLPSSIDNLSETIKNFQKAFKEAIPIKLVIIMFAIVFVLISGIQGLQALIKLWIPHG